jgi:hypothetical protein
MVAVADPMAVVMVAAHMVVAIAGDGWGGREQAEHEACRQYDCDLHRNPPYG